MTGYCCDADKALKVYKNYPTEFADVDWLSILFESEAIDLTNFNAQFIFGSVHREWTDLTQGITINLSEEETGALPVGLNYATLIVEDTAGNSKPFSTAIPVEVLTWVEGDQELDTYNMTVNVLLDNETQMVIKIETAKVSLDWVEEKIAEHNSSEEAHPYIQGRIDDETTARENADSALSDRIDEKQDKLTSENAGEGISIEGVGGVVKITNTRVSAEWGKISGTLSNQTDLKNALDNLSDDISDEASARASADQTLTNRYNSLNTAVSDIQAVIPNDATAQNQLADKSFVNSSIATSTANFIGTFNSVAEMEAYSGTLTNNDYSFVETTDSAGNTLYDRYKWNGSEWLFEYELNNSSFTADQWAAINSNATESKIAQITTNSTNITTLQGQIADKQDTITDLATIRSNATAGKQASDTIATYGDIVTHNVSEFATSAQGTKADTAIQGVQVNGADLTPDINKKVNVAVPTNTNQLTNGAGFITGIDSLDVINALGYTPVDSLELAPVATSGEYSDLSGTPTIPTVGNGTITITQGGTTKGSFTTNQSGDTTIDLDAGGSGEYLPIAGGNISGDMSVKDYASFGNGIIPSVDGYELYDYLETYSTSSYLIIPGVIDRIYNRDNGVIYIDGQITSFGGNSTSLTSAQELNIKINKITSSGEYAATEVSRLWNFTYPIIGCMDGSDFIVSLNNGVFNFSWSNGTTSGSSSFSIEKNVEQSDTGFMLGGSSYTRIRIRQIRLGNNGISGYTKLDDFLVPAKRISDNAIGMYDLVRKIFYVASLSSVGGGASQVNASFFSGTNAKVDYYIGANNTPCIGFDGITSQASLLITPPSSASGKELVNAEWVTNQGYITSAALNGYAKEDWVEEQGFLKKAGIFYWGE